MVQKSLVSQGLLITEASRSHSDTSHSIEHFRRSNFYLTTQGLQGTDIHAPAEIETRDTSKQTTADPHHRRRGHGDRHKQLLVSLINWLAFVMEIVVFLCGVGTEIFKYCFVCFKVLKA